MYAWLGMLQSPSLRYWYALFASWLSSCESSDSAMASARCSAEDSLPFVPAARSADVDFVMLFRLHPCLLVEGTDYFSLL